MHISKWMWKNDGIRFLKRTVINAFEDLHSAVRPLKMAALSEKTRATSEKMQSSTDWGAAERNITK